MDRRVARALRVLACLTALAVPVHGQTIDDGIMLAGRELQTANLYSHDSWDAYWEGTLLRTNGNIGTLTTQTNVWTANYGVTDRLNVIGMVPYVWTRASQGVLHGIDGFQDLTLAAKWNFLDTPIAGAGSFKAIAVISAGIPLTDYNPELPPLSIGSGSTRIAWRGTVNYQSVPGWFINGSAAFTWQSQVPLDRPYFYTDDEFVMSNQVDMPNVLDYAAGAGYMKGGFMTAASLSLLRTLSGGDIRRQDMPFISNRMQFFKGSAMVMVPVPGLGGLAGQFAIAHTFDGRNVGQATTLTAGVLYTFNRRSAE